MDEPLSKYIEWRDSAGYKAALIEILTEGHARTEDIQTLKRVADPAPRDEGPYSGTPEALSLQMFIGNNYHTPHLRQDARIALVVLGQGNEPEVLDWITKSAKQYFAETSAMHFSPVDFLLLVAMDNEAALPAIRSIFETTSRWSTRIACLYRMPESKRNGTFELIESFRKWVLNSTDSNWSYLVDWVEWKNFVSCMTVDGIREFYRRGGDWSVAPGTIERSPLIKWAIEQGQINWLKAEWQWLRSKGTQELVALRNRLVAVGVQEVVEYCCEQIKNAQPEDYTHTDIIQNALRLHPKPYPRNVLDACVEVIRRPSHASQYQHRIDALEMLIDGVNSGNYSRQEAEALIVKLAETETDPDVRAAAIRSVPWAFPTRAHQILAGALEHESSRIREAATQALAKVCQLKSSG